MRHYLTELEARQVAAIAERIFPAGDGGPGAADLHVLDYIDRQLGGAWGRGARMYRQPPFVRPRHAGHGWQSPLTPAEVYRRGLAALSVHTRRRYGAEYADLPAADQDEVLTRLAAGEATAFVEPTAAEFFELVRQGVVEGLFADPAYGGNHGLAGWRWIGYPGVASAHGDDYRERMGLHDEAYEPEPRALP